MNITMLVGRLTKDSELRFTENEKKVGNFTLAINRDYKNANGEYETDFINCVVFGEQAETLNKYTHKGDLIAVCGRINTGSYEKDGKKVYTMNIVVDQVKFLQAKREEDNPYKDMSVKVEASQQVEISPEDLPF